MAEVSSLTLRINTEGMSEAQKGLEGLTNTSTMLEDAIKKVTAAFAAFKAASFIADITQLAARYDTLGVVMRVVGNNAGYTGAQMETLAVALQKQGISMTESRNTLSMMASAHVDLANATKLGRVAQDAAVIGNLNSSEAFQRMIYGIQSGQVEILRTIGLNVNFEQSYKKVAAQLGKTVQDLTEVEKVHIRTNVVMEKGKDIARAYEESLGTVGKAAKSMERIWENLQVVMGAVFQPAFTVIIQGLTDAMQTATDWTKKNAKAVEDLGLSIKATMVASEGFTKLLSDIGGGAAGASSGVGFLTRVFQGISLIIAGTTDVLRGFLGTLMGAIATAIQYVGVVADLATKLAGFSGKGGISNFGDSMSEYARGILNDLNTQTSTGNALDAMMSSHGGAVSSGSEAQRIAAGEARRREDARLAAIEAAKNAAGIYTDTRPIRGFAEEGKELKPIHERTVPDIEAATVATKVYGVSVSELDRLMKQLRKDSMDSWDIIAEVVDKSSHHATDALVSWMDNLDGVGRSWKTLGDTVKSVIRDMLIQMQRAIIQQQMMDPLMRWASVGSNWAGLFGSGGRTGTTSFDTGTGNYGDSGFDANFSKVGMGGKSTGVQNNVVITVTPGNGADPGNATGASLDLFKTIEPALNQWAVKNSRQGGILVRA